MNERIGYVPSPHELTTGAVRPTLETREQVRMDDTGEQLKGVKPEPQKADNLNTPKINPQEGSGDLGNSNILPGVPVIRSESNIRDGVPPLETGNTANPPKTPAEVAANRAEEVLRLMASGEYHRQTFELARMAPQQEAVLQHQENAGPKGSKFTNYRVILDDSVIRNDRLREIVADFNSLGAGNSITKDMMIATRDKIREEQRRVVGGIPKDQADIIVNQLNGNINFWSREEAQQAAEARRRGFYNELKLTPDEKEIIVFGEQSDIDELFNRMFDRADVNPRTGWENAFGTAGRLEFEEFMQTLISARNPDSDLRLRDPSVQAKIHKNIIKYSSEMKLREIMHTTNYAVLASVGTEQLVNYTQGFQADLADVAYGKKGVKSMWHFYEQSLFQIMAENNGFLPDREVIGDVDAGEIGRAEKITREKFRLAVETGGITHKDSDTGRILKVVTRERYDAMPADARGDYTPIDEWEINRAFSLATGMGIITGRTVEIASLSKLPEKGGGYLASLFMQDVIKDIAPIRHLLGKYDIGEQGLRMLGFFLNRKKKAWTYDELQELKMDNHHAIVSIINNLSGDPDDRFLNILSPFNQGSIWSRSTWRYGQEDEQTSALGRVFGESARYVASTTNGVGEYTDDDPKSWIGTGTIIEFERDKLDPKKEDNKKSVTFRGEGMTRHERAKRVIEISLDRTARVTPLKLFYNLEPLRDAVVERAATFYSETEAIMDSHGNPIAGRNRVKMSGNEFDSDIRVISALQERAINNHEPRLAITEETVPDPAQRDRITRLVDLIQREFTEGGANSRREKLIGDLRDSPHRVPFVFGTEDMPLDSFEFVKGGSTSIARRWRDIASGAKAGAGLLKLVAGASGFKKIEDVVGAMSQIHHAIEEYDAGLAKRVTLRIAEGVGKFYNKDIISRLPFGVGTLMGIISGKASFAQYSFGRDAMAWDEFQTNEFTRLLRDHNMLTVEQQHELQGNIGGGKKELVLATIRTLAPLILFAILFSLMKRMQHD